MIKVLFFFFFYSLQTRQQTQNYNGKRHISAAAKDFNFYHYICLVYKLYHFLFLFIAIKNGYYLMEKSSCQSNILYISNSLQKTRNNLLVHCLHTQLTSNLHSILVTEFLFFLLLLQKLGHQIIKKKYSYTKCK